VKPETKKRILKIAAGAALGGAGLVAAANAWILHAAGPYVVDRIEVEDVPSRTVGIVLGARVHPDGRPSPMLEDRLEAARALYAAGRVHVLLVSGDHAAAEYDEVAAMRGWLVAHGVPARDVVEDHAGLRTLDTVERAVRVFEVRDAVVVTQGFHAARATWLARRAGIDAVGYAAPRVRSTRSLKNEAREVLARAGAIVDVIAGTEPRHLGPPLPIASR
jgi:SanA protein